MFLLCNPSCFQPVIDSPRLKDPQKLAGLNTIMIKKSNYSKYFAKKEKNQKLTDPEFSPQFKSLQYKVSNRQITWKRVSQIVPECVLFSQPIKATDVYYGNTKDKYFLPTLAVLARYPNRIKNIFYHSQSIQQQGIYRLLVKIGGQIHQIIIDDFVPVYQDTGKTVFCKPNQKEVWAMLLEKAWAKLKGSYGAILKGTPHEVLSTFCIGPCMSYDLTSIVSKEKQDKLFQNLTEAYLKNFVICAFSSKYCNLEDIIKETVYPITGIYSNRYVKINNYVQPISQIKLNSSNILQMSHSTNLQREYGERVIKIQELIDNFSVISISHQNGTFNSEFLSIKIIDTAFIKFQVIQDAHQAYIIVQKCKKLNESNGSHPYLRLFLANQIEDDRYQFLGLKEQLSLNECFIHLPQIKPGKNILLIKTNSKEEDCNYTVTYSWKNNKKPIQKASISTVFKRQPIVSKFLQSALLSHYQNKHKVNIKKEGEQIQAVDLIQDCGLAYIFCSLSIKSQYKLKVTIDHKQLKQNGLQLIGQYGPRYTVSNGSTKIFVFEVIKEKVQFSLPPKGFKIAKVSVSQ